MNYLELESIRQERGNTSRFNKFLRPIKHVGYGLSAVACT